VSRQSRIVGFGAAALMVLAGILAAVFVSDGTGQIVAMVLIGLGLVLATSLVFLEVGLSEDRELAREAKRRQRPPRRAARSSLGRMRGRRRRLR
jgi:heme A synthase